MEISKEVLKELTDSLVSEEIKKMKLNLAPLVRLEISKYLKSQRFKTNLSETIKYQLDDEDFFSHLSRAEYSALLKRAVKAALKV